MNRDGPRQLDRVLFERAKDVFLLLFCVRINHVALVLPDLFLQYIEFSGIHFYLDPITIDAFNLRQFSVEVGLLHVVLHEHHLCAFLQLYALKNGVHALWKLLAHSGFKAARLAGKFGQGALVQFVRDAVVGGQGDHAFRLLIGNCRDVVLVQFRDVFGRYRIVPQVVQDVDELPVALPEDLVQLDVRVAILFDHLRLEEVRAGVPTFQHAHFVVFHDWRQLVQIADQQHLRSAEALIAILSHTAHAEVDRVQQVGPQHAHLINDQQIHFAQHIAAERVERMPAHERILIVERAVFAKVGG